MADRTVTTVLGPVAGTALGACLAHEHVIYDLGCYFSQSADDPDGTLAEGPLAPERRWWVHQHPMSQRANLVQDSVKVAVSELSRFKAAGGGALVDVTTTGIGPQPEQLREVARQTGLHIVAGTGYYLAGSLPAWVASASEAELADGMRRDLLEGFPGTTVHAGLIGELGISDPLAPVEQRVLAAAGRVQRELGCAAILHPSWGRDGGLRAAQLAEDAGLDPSRTALSHLDVRFRSDVEAYRQVAARGFYLDMDCWGRDAYYPHVNSQLPSDAERIDVVRRLLDAGLERQLLFAQDICLTYELERHGGHGYAHLLRTVQPRMQRSGITGETFTRIMVENPRTWLAGS